MISFDALAGNNALKNSLKHALNERFPQTVLLSGDDPAALKTLATVLAAGILCEGTGSHPCGNCLPCRKVEQGVHPDLIVGDFDSAPQPDTDSDTIVLPHVKDDTDTHYAAKWLLENGYTQVTMLGALGGARLEHTIANLSTGLFLAEHGVDVVLADTASEIHYLVPGKDLTLQRGEWQYLSVFPWDGKLIGVDIEGAYYPLHGAELVPDYPLGVSNEFVEPTVTLRCQTGHGIVVLTRAD